MTLQTYQLHYINYNYNKLVQKNLNQFPVVITPDGNVGPNQENTIVYLKSDYKKKENKCDIKHLSG